MRRPEPGFTLLESIVALAILSVGLMAAFAWFDRDVDALRRMDRVALESVVLDVALARLKRIDLASERDGTFQWRGYQVDWKATVFDERTGRAMRGTRSYFDHELHSVELVISLEDRTISERHLMLNSARLRDDIPAMYE